MVKKYGQVTIHGKWLKYKNIRNMVNFEAKTRSQGISTRSLDVIVIFFLV